MITIHVKITDSTTSSSILCFCVSCSFPECLQLKDCSKKPLPLLVPSLPSCLPAPLRSITWSLVHSADGSAEILSPSDGLQRSLPGQLCNGSLVLAVASVDDRASLGTFCPGGPIRSVQFRTNASITASVDQASPIGLRLSAPESQLRAHFKEKITGTPSAAVPAGHVFRLL